MEHKEYKRMIPGSPGAVLALHGIVGTPNHFKELLDVVPEDWSVHAVLLEGHGGTVEEFGRASMKKWKAQVFAALEALLEDHDKVYVLAHSMGTLFAMQMAVRYPGRIAGLFLLGSPLRVFVQPRAAWNAVKMSFGVVDPKDRSAVDMRAGCSVAAEWRLWKYIFWIPRFLELLGEIWQTRKLLPKIAVPTWVFQSKKDELVHFSSRKDFVGYDAITCTDLMDSGHFGYGEADLALLRQRLGQMLEG